MPHSAKSSDVEEQLPPDVERITPPPQCGIFGTIVIRLVLGVLLLGAGVLAVYYSIEVHSDSHVESNAETTFFTLRHVQSCSSGGVITREVHKNDDSNGVHVHESKKVSSVWIQDDTKSRIFYSIGTEGHSDWEKSFYVLSDHTLIVENTSCCRHEAGYNDFIDSFGLDTLVLMRTEDISIEEEDEYVTVNFFQGEPKGHPNAAQTPFLAFGYMDQSDSLSYAWQAYYPDNVTGGIYFSEHWYPNMKNVPVDANLFINVPEACYSAKKCTEHLQLV